LSKKEEKKKRKRRKGKEEKQINLETKQKKVVTLKFNKQQEY
jgi:hypothetical protein